MYLTFQKSALKVLKCNKKSKKNCHKKVTVWGCLISSQNPNEKLLISYTPSKWTVKQKKVNFLEISSIQDFR